MSNNFYDNFKNLKIVNNIHVCCMLERKLIQNFLKL